jgi:hypothetical protein
MVADLLDFERQHAVSRPGGDPASPDIAAAALAENSFIRAMYPGLDIDELAADPRWDLLASGYRLEYRALGLPNEEALYDVDSYRRNIDLMRWLGGTGLSAPDTTPKGRPAVRDLLRAAISALLSVDTPRRRTTR